MPAVSDTDSDLFDLLRDELHSAARRAGLPARTADELARSLEERVRRDLRGDTVYVAACDRIERARRIAAEYDPRRPQASRDAVCKRHGISTSTFYRSLHLARQHPEKTP